MSLVLCTLVQWDFHTPGPDLTPTSPALESEQTIGLMCPTECSRSDPVSRWRPGLKSSAFTTANTASWEPAAQ